MSLCYACVLFTLTFISTIQADVTGDYYTAAVVEYAADTDATLDPVTNINNNLKNYLSFIKEASVVKADIIVFPEVGLIGKGNQVYFSEVPNASDAIIPCAHNISSIALVQLSCAARTYNIYVVVNLPEIYYNTTSGETQHFNTDVVFDRNGTIIARYRKYNLFGEKSYNVPPLDHVYFDTDFGVRFGVFICFDIAFKSPPVTLVRDYNIRHFVFSLSWISELPFLTAVQSQWFWSYSQDVVLLASGYNDPTVGASGSGIYQGHLGALSYTMTDTRGSKLLYATVSKNNFSSNAYINSTQSFQGGEATTGSLVSTSSSPGLWMLQDFVDRYKTELLLPPPGLSDMSYNGQNSDQQNGTEIDTTLTVFTTICQRTICCDFNLSMTTTYRQDYGNHSNRGDDFNSFYYRLAAFDGVRTYSGFATGGVQLCSVIACVDETLESCGLRADDKTASPNRFYHDLYGNMIQTKTVFNRIQVDARFQDGNALIVPDVFVTGSGDSFGSLVDNSVFRYQTLPPFNGSAYCELRALTEINNLITFGVYSRQFDRDGQPQTPVNPSRSSIITHNYLFLFIALTFSIFYLFY